VETEVTLIDEGGQPGGASARGFHLLVMAPDAFVAIPLPERGQVTIGRGSDSHVKLDDPLASRRHAVLRVDAGRFQVQDAGSANGIRVRDERLPPESTTTVEVGEAMVIGATVLMVQQNRASVGMRRLASHTAFESRVEDECARAAVTGGAFAVVRLKLDRGAPWARVLPVLCRELPPPHFLASYGPSDFEALLVEVQPAEIDRLVGQTLAGLRGAGLTVRAAVSIYPTGGRSAQALLSHLDGQLKPGRVDPGGLDVASGRDPKMEVALRLCARAAASSINVLILGETGVGKEVLARSLHAQSSRGKAPFLALNCAGLAETLIESELFGYERGAFTGAATAKTGLLESANGGTVFLDEIGEMPLTLQARLLRVLETREVLPVGGVKTRTIDVRFASATNRDLEADVLAGGFRRDLFFRLNGLSISIPPLRERVGEIPGLTEQFLEQACRESGRPAPRLAPPALELLLSYRWPGNIRELKNVIERAVVLCDGDVIDLGHLPVEKMRPAASVVIVAPTPAPLLSPETSVSGSVPGLPGMPFLDPASLSAADQAERDRILHALKEHAGNQTAASQALGIPRRTFVARLTRYGIPRPRKRA
jgi:two-component system, NtrC family, response regulator AtoC